MIFDRADERRRQSPTHPTHQGQSLLSLLTRMQIWFRAVCVTAMGAHNGLVHICLFGCLLAILTLTSVARADLSDETLIVGTEADYPPYTVLDDAGHASGFANDLLQAIAHATNLNLRFQVDTWSENRRRLEAGEIAFIPLMARSALREQAVAFSDSYAEGYDAIFVPNTNSTVRSEDDLVGKKVIVQKGDLSDDQLSARIAKAKAETGQEPFTLVYSSSVTESFKILLEGGGDVYVGSQLTALAALQKFDSPEVHMATKPMMSGYSRVYAFAIRKNDTELLHRVNAGLKSVIASGEYSRIYHKWFSKLDPAIREREARAKRMNQLAVGLGLACLVAIAALTLVVIFRREVDRKTRFLAESELRFKNLATNLPGAVFSCELPNVSVPDRFKVTFVSDFVNRITGYPAQHFLEVSPPQLLEMIHPDDRESVAHAVVENVNLGRRTEIEFRIVHRDGSVHWIQARAANPQTNPKNGRLVMNGILFDITETKAINDLLAQQQTKLAGSARLSALGEMAGGIAHEINNPLAIINLRTHQLTQMAKKGPVKPEDAAMVATGIETTAHRISKIVRSLQKVSRDSDGDPFELISVREIIDETFELCFQRMFNNGISVELADFPSNLMIECRRVQISQVLINILNNAFDAVITKSERSVCLNIRDLEDRIEISISNTGPRIPVELAHKIFQPFFTTKGVGKGTGLGLSISKGLIESHGGEIHLDPAHTKTCFVITLPKLQTKTAADLDDEVVSTSSLNSKVGSTLST